MTQEPLTNYYRVLSSQSHFAGWNQTSVANSSHHRPPVQWIQQWAVGENKADPNVNYPLWCEEFGKKVKFTPRAREVFLIEPGWFIPENQNSNSRRWFEVGELDGICAFASPQECYAYGELNPRLPHLYVVFLGKKVCDAPEQTGVVAEVIKKSGDPQSPEEFAKNYIHAPPRPTF
jgi:hypothetical protein